MFNDDILHKMKKTSKSTERKEVFCKVAKEWSDYHFPTLAPRTLSCYEAPLKKAIEYFNETYIEELKINDLQTYINLIAETGRAKKTVKNYKIVLNLIFRYAMIHGYIESNPMQYVSIPRNLRQTPRRFPSEEEINKVKNSYGTTFSFFFILILYTGLRRGEALALKYEDIDLKNNVIHVEKSLYHMNGIPYVKSPKTDSGFRDVPILEPLKTFLTGKGSGPIFSNATGQYLDRNEVEHLIKMFQKDNQLKITPHQLRHAYATILFEAGVSDKDAQDLLGHAQISTTKDIYTHISKKRKAQTAAKIEDYLRFHNITYSKCAPGAHLQQ